MKRKKSNKLFRTVLTLVSFMSFGFLQAQEVIKASLEVMEDKGHPIEMGASGFNVRIADKVWGYNHPDFREAVHSLRPGWLRYFSGTMGDAFSAATGEYNLDYAMMMDHQEQYFRGNKFVNVKGPHRIIDLYHLLGEVQGKLVVTINGFTETPEMTKALAQFCKNNNIVVDAWQFCNEPYFYVPNRNRYWWNDGYDYALKMKPHAEAIKEVFPDAKMALNFTWDGIWDFMKEIHRYQEEQGAYWNVFSKHSYAPHVGGVETFDQARKRANTKIAEVTSADAMKEIEEYTAPGIPLLITEFGVWNRPLNGIYSAIYNAEYTLRQLAHPNAFLIGSHEISNKARPKKNLNNRVLEAFEKGESIDTDKLRTGVELDDEGKALKILHHATNNSQKVFPIRVEGTLPVMGMKDEQVGSVYAMYFDGVDGLDYLAIINRSGHIYQFNPPNMKGEEIKAYKHQYIWSATAENENVTIIEEHGNGEMTVKPFSVNLFEFENKGEIIPQETRIYKTEVENNGVKLIWWDRPNATAYEVVKIDEEGQLESKTIARNEFLWKGLEKGKSYSFEVITKIGERKSRPSNIVNIDFMAPSKPEIFKLSKRGSSITVFWHSVPGATGYNLELRSSDGEIHQHYDAHNVFGYRLSGLEPNKNYQIKLSAYNGLGSNGKEEVRNVYLPENIPLPARNISATETIDGKVFLQWIIQDTVHTDTKYNIYRGTIPHEFELYAENVSGNQFVDEKPGIGKDYFYTVKAVLESEELAFYPNIATVIKKDPSYTMVIDEVSQDDESFKIKVEMENVDIDKTREFGVMLDDVSYLNLESKAFKSNDINHDGFEVIIPKTKLIKGRAYSIKAYAKSRKGELNSLPPFNTFKVN